MKNTKIKQGIAVCLTAAMVFLTACGSNTVTEETSTGESESASITEYNATTENVTKSETVYVNLDSLGNTKKITVSDWLHADQSQVRITDRTTLTDFTVTKGQAASVAENGNLTWHMTTSDVYYEGETDADLPVDISVKYYLNDAEITPEELAGQSGKFRMEVTMKSNISKEVEIDGQTVTMYAPLAVAGGMVLSYEKFSDIEVTNGLSIGGGSYEVVVLAGMPGLNESLNLSALDIAGFEDFSFPETFTVSATVTDFSLGDTYYAVLPLSALSLDMDLPSTLQDVMDVLNEVEDLQDILDTIDPNQVLANFITDGTSLNEMMEALDSGISLYEDNRELLEALSEFMTPENIEILTEFMNSLDSEEMQNLISLMSNVPALQSLVDSMLQLSTGLSDVMPILEGMSEALSDPTVAAQLENLPETLESLDELINYLNENQEALNILSQLMASEDMEDLSGVLDSIISSTGSLGDTDVSELTGDAKELVLRMDEWLQFDYSIFTDAADYMDTSCMFIYKTDPISAE
ncbi:MAG: hypothetical protein LUG85_02065 [Clostridiales bacterium]|nr:hypothetical protein [Clostridiales bacterium]